jgi:hypothetical protein
MNGPNDHQHCTVDSNHLGHFTVDDFLDPWTNPPSLNFPHDISLGEADIEHFPELDPETEDYL